MYRVANVNADGTFRLSGAPPGSYRLMAFRTLTENAWFDAELARRMQHSGMLVDLHEGSTVKVTLEFASPNCQGDSIP